MQLGFTLFEEMVFSDGQVVNASLADYKIPGMLDIPHDLQAAFVEYLTATDRSAQREWAKRASSACPSDCERSTTPSASQHSICLTPERVLRAIRETERRPLESDR